MDVSREAQDRMLERELHRYAELISVSPSPDPSASARPSTRGVTPAPCIDHAMRTVALYVQSFGPFTPRTASLWPAARTVMAELGVGVAGLNDAAAGWPTAVGSDAISPGVCGPPRRPTPA